MDCCLLIKDCPPRTHFRNDHLPSLRFTVIRRATGCIYCIRYSFLGWRRMRTSLPSGIRKTSMARMHTLVRMQLFRLYRPTHPKHSKSQILTPFFIHNLALMPSALTHSQLPPIGIYQTFYIVTIWKRHLVISTCSSCLSRFR